MLFHPSRHRHWAFRLRTLMGLVLVIGVPLAFVAVRERQRRIVEMLRHPILEAAERGDTEAVRILLDQGADVNSVASGRYPWTPLMNASFRGNLETAKLLLDRGADVNRADLDFFTSLTLAAGEGHWEVVRRLVERGADVHLSDGYSKTALDYAREKGGPPDLVRLLESKTGRP